MMTSHTRASNCSVCQFPQKTDHPFTLNTVQITVLGLCGKSHHKEEKKTHMKATPIPLHSGLASFIIFIIWLCSSLLPAFHAAHCHQSYYQSSHLRRQWWSMRLVKSMGWTSAGLILNANRSATFPIRKINLDIHLDVGRCPRNGPFYNIMNLIGQLP